MYFDFPSCSLYAFVKSLPLSTLTPGNFDKADSLNFFTLSLFKTNSLIFFLHFLIFYLYF